MKGNSQILKNITIENLYKISKNEDNWIDFLDFCINHYNYTFNQQIQIYSQRPDAKLCAEINVWNKKLHRWIKKGSKGICLIEYRNGIENLKYVFDISDTYDKFGRKIKQWSLDPKYEDELIKSLENSSQNHSESKKDLAESIISYSYLKTQISFNDYFYEFKKLKIDSFLKLTDDKTLEYYFLTMISNSVSYIVLKRCRKNPFDYFSKDDFDSIRLFNTISILSGLGNAVNEIAREELGEIYKYINNIKEKENSTFEIIDTVNYNRVKENKDIKTGNDTVEENKE